MTPTRSKTYLFLGSIGLALGTLACQKQSTSSPATAGHSLTNTLLSEKLSDVEFSCTPLEFTDPYEETSGQKEEPSGKKGLPPAQKGLALSLGNDALSVQDGKGAVSVGTEAIYAKRKGTKKAPVKVMNYDVDAMVSSVTGKRLTCGFWVRDLNDFAEAKEMKLNDLTLEYRLAPKGGYLDFGPNANSKVETPRLFIPQEDAFCLTQSFGPLCKQNDTSAKNVTPALQTYRKYMTGIDSKYIQSKPVSVKIGSYIQNLLGDIPKDIKQKEVIFCKVDELKVCLEAKGGTPCFSLTSGKAQCQSAKPGNSSKRMFDLKSLEYCVGRAEDAPGGATAAGSCTTDSLMPGI